MVQVFGALAPARSRCPAPGVHSGKPRPVVTIQDRRLATTVGSQGAECTAGKMQYRTTGRPGRSPRKYAQGAEEEETRVASRGLARLALLASGLGVGVALAATRGWRRPTRSRHRVLMWPPRSTRRRGSRVPPPTRPGQRIRMWLSRSMGSRCLRKAPRTPPRALGPCDRSRPNSIASAGLFGIGSTGDFSSLTAMAPSPPTSAAALTSPLLWAMPAQPSPTATLTPPPSSAPTASPKPTLEMGPGFRHKHCQCSRRGRCRRQHRQQRFKCPRQR